MIEVVIVGEGQTEESFLRDVLGPALAEQEVFLQPRLIWTSSTGRGGALSRDRVIRYLRNSLRERGDVYVATFFDLYNLADDFPGVREAMTQRDPLVRARAIETRLAEVVIEAAGCRPDRFIPHIQPHEFEALLFTDVSCLAEIRPEWRGLLAALAAARAAAESPEHIDDGPDSHPSMRLAKILRPRFDKLLHGPQVAARIGLDRIRRECVHFGRFVARLEALGAVPDP